MRTLIAANWKMHGDLSWVQKPGEFNGLLPEKKRSSIDILICPPFPFISALQDGVAKASIALGGQDCHWAQTGAHTGEVSAEMLKMMGASYVIVGHSERRAGGETSQIVQTKAEAAHRAGLMPIICVGETLDQREAGKAKSVVKDMLAASLPETTQSNRDDVVIAYEPVWAIGTGKTASTEDIADMHKLIRAEVGPRVRILYGGSVKPANAKEILGTRNVNGALIGGAGLDMKSLSEIAQFAL